MADSAVEASCSLTLMGTGTSVGVPVVGCDCHVCTSTNPKNQRYRSGVLLRLPDGEMVIDTGPELRLQLLANQASLVRAAVFTHSHADHVMGLDDLRIFGFRLEHQLRKAAEQKHGEQFDENRFINDAPGHIPLFCEPNVEQDIRQMFHYAFSDPSTHSHRFAAPRLRFSAVQPGVAFKILGQSVLPIRLKHGNLPILGYRFNNVAFCTDVSSIPAESEALLQGLEVLIIDALRDSPHPTHLSVAQAAKWANRLGAKRTILTHMSHDLEYEELRQRLPAGIEPGYDGLTVPLS